jgi:hypothetical protein
LVVSVFSLGRAIEYSAAKTLFRKPPRLGHARPVLGAQNQAYARILTGKKGDTIGTETGTHRDSTSRHVATDSGDG